MSYLTRSYDDIRSLTPRMQGGLRVRLLKERRISNASSRGSSIVMPNSGLPTLGGCITYCKVRLDAGVVDLLSLMQKTGTFAETSSPEHQLHWIVENCKVVRAANGMNNIVEAMKIACSKHDLLWLAPFCFSHCYIDC